MFGVDHSAQILTVTSEANPQVHELLTELRVLTGTAAPKNTRFNVAVSQ